ncbi:MAG TPA: hypothetical protein VL201_03260 [Patescibacteria group bacterium]|nr:hypothetical protein [Patescibacteria group bacterium]
MLKKNSGLIIFFIGYAFFMHTSIKGMEEENNIVNVYFHGFGEVGNPQDGPVFPDGPLQFGKAAFFTKRNVILAAKYLKQKVVVEGHNILHLEGKSMGAGILINCLYKLVYYREDCFEGTDISQQDATDILAAVNRGKIALSTPLLSMEKTCIVAFASQLASYSSILAACGFAAYHKWLFAEWLINNQFDRNVQIFGFFLASIMMIGGCRHRLENMYSKFIDRYIIPLATRGKYDPSFIKPDAAAYYLAPHLSCPVLIHCSRNDEILKNDEDIIKFHHVFHFRENTASTYFLLSDDDTHDTNNLQYKEVRLQFFHFSQGRFTNFWLDKQYGISNSFKDKTLPLQDHSRVAKEIADLKRNSVSDFVHLGRSVLQAFRRL